MFLHKTVFQNCILQNCKKRSCTEHIMVKRVTLLKMLTQKVHPRTRLCEHFIFKSLSLAFSRQNFQLYHGGGLNLEKSTTNDGIKKFMSCGLRQTFIKKLRFTLPQALRWIYMKNYCKTHLRAHVFSIKEVKLLSNSM